MVPSAITDAVISGDDIALVEDQFIAEHEDDVVDCDSLPDSDTLPMDVPKAPVIYSWGRSDTNTLLRSPNDPSSVDGVQALTFANQRTILQVGFHISAFDFFSAR